MPGVHPEASSLWRCVAAHFEEFLQVNPERYQHRYGVLPEVVGKFLECSDLEKGFARVHCPECRHDFLVAFPVIRALLPLNNNSPQAPIKLSYDLRRPVPDRATIRQILSRFGVISDTWPQPPQWRQAEKLRPEISLR